MFHTPTQSIPHRPVALHTLADRGKEKDDDDPSSKRVSELLTRLMSVGPQSGEVANPASVLEDEMLEAKRHAMWYGGQSRIDRALELASRHKALGLKLADCVGYKQRFLIQSAEAQ